jgi:phthalate 4,5-dioxygenase
MKAHEFSGIRGVVTQDHAVSETQGRILDRTKEHLGSSDVAVVAWRRLLLKAARELVAHGTAPAALDAALPWKILQADTKIYSNTRGWKEEIPLDKNVAIARAAAS